MALNFLSWYLRPLVTSLFFPILPLPCNLLLMHPQDETKCSTSRISRPFCMVSTWLYRNSSFFFLLQANFHLVCIYLFFRSLSTYCLFLEDFPDAPHSAPVFFIYGAIAFYAHSSSIYHTAV